MVNSLTFMGTEPRKQDPKTQNPSPGHGNGHEKDRLGVILQGAIAGTYAGLQSHV